MTAMDALPDLDPDSSLDDEIVEWLDARFAAAEARVEARAQRALQLNRLRFELL